MPSFVTTHVTFFTVVMALKLLLLYSFKHGLFKTQPKHLSVLSLGLFLWGPSAGGSHILNLSHYLPLSLYTHKYKYTIFRK